NHYIDREISWLNFNERVLQEAADSEVALLDRIRFLGIFSNNLDEFFRVRYASIRRLAMDKKGKRILESGMEAHELLSRITQIVNEQQTQSSQGLDQIQNQLAAKNIHNINKNQLDKEQEIFVKGFFTH